ncbi:hypothetical protein FRX31_030092, partial [Thalictrum thalictroides]
EAINEARVVVLPIFENEEDEQLEGELPNFEHEGDDEGGNELLINLVNKKRRVNRKVTKKKKSSKKKTTKKHTSKDVQEHVTSPGKRWSIRLQRKRTSESCRAKEGEDKKLKKKKNLVVHTPAAENVVVVPTLAAEETTTKKKKSKKSKKKRDKQPSKRIRYTRSGDEAYAKGNDVYYQEAEQEEQDVERQVIQETEYADTQADKLDLNFEVAEDTQPVAEDTQPVAEDTQPATQRSRKRPWKKGDTPPPVDINELPEEELDLDKNYYDDIEDRADEINAEEGYKSLPDSDNEEPGPYDEFEENCEDVFKSDEDKEHPVHNFCHELLTMNAYKRAYENAVFPISNDFEWDEPSYVVLPPPRHRPTGRPRGKRRRGEDKPVKSGAKPFKTRTSRAFQVPPTISLFFA